MKLSKCTDRQKCYFCIRFYYTPLLNSSKKWLFCIYTINNREINSNRKTEGERDRERYGQRGRETERDMEREGKFKEKKLI